jgi:hypothetical protein
MESSDSDTIIYTELLARERERIAPVNVHKDFGGVDKFLTKVRCFRSDDRHLPARRTWRVRPASGLCVLPREGIHMQCGLESYARTVRGLVPTALACSSWRRQWVQDDCVHGCILCAAAALYRLGRRAIACQAGFLHSRMSVVARAEVLRCTDRSQTCAGNVIRYTGSESYAPAPHHGSCATQMRADAGPSRPARASAASGQPVRAHR